MDAGHLGIFTKAFSTICGTHFLEIQAAVSGSFIIWLKFFNMPPCRKPEYQTLRISLDEARVEVALLRVQMYRFGCSCKDSEFQRISDCLSLLLSYIQYKGNQEKKK